MIRKANPSDFERILDMAEQFWTHTCYKEPFNREATMPYIQMAHDCELLAVAEADGKVKGFCAIYPNGARLRAVSSCGSRR